MKEQYTPETIEPAVQTEWETKQVYRVTEDTQREKFYCLSMLPYPSGKLHMGHVRNYTIGDVIARFQRMQGKNVLHPIGWDAFGLPAENAAIQHQMPPARWTYDNIATMRTQLKRLGFSFDWSREIATCHPNYYHWEQWLFTRLYRKGLVYKKSSIVNWDPVDQTVLANEQVVDGRGWRSGALVEQREIPQWFLKITAYADELLEKLDTLTGWPEKVLTMQRNWIGRSEGVEIHFMVAEAAEPIKVFTTRPDTLFGISYLAIAPQHPLAIEAAKEDPDLAAFIEECSTGTVAEAELARQEKRGIPTRLKARHPVSGESIPVWVANYVLATYGTGAVMGVPAHDERDFEFAQKYHLPIRKVVVAPEVENHDYSQSAMTTKGMLIHSGIFTGKTSEDAFEAIAEHLKQHGRGERQVHYRLRDWGISRQRYWGTPIPIIYCKTCGSVPVPDKDLPVRLPEQVKFEGATSPLKKMPEFYQVPCPQCGQTAERETDTFDTFVESSWYYARYTCPDQNKAMLDERVHYWGSVDQYIGGIEHAVMHLLYARFYHKLLRDEGLVNTDEPFTGLLTQGMVLKDGAKMSKSKGNVVEPNEIIDKLGADTARLFSMFAAPPEQSLEWNDAGVEGCHRFLKRLWKLAARFVNANPPTSTQPSSQEAGESETRRLLHLTIQKVTDDMGRRRTFNTAIAAIMEFFNALSQHPPEEAAHHALLAEGLEAIVLMLAPITPHICHTLWEALGHTDNILEAKWPQYDEQAVLRNTVTMVVQVNGKVRGEIEVSKDASREAIEAAALANPNVQRFIADHSVKKVIVVPGKLINIVVAS